LTDGSNETVDIYNRFLQRDRLARHELHGDGFSVHNTNDNRRWTLYEGDHVIFLRGDFTAERNIRNGSAGTIVALNTDKGKATVKLSEGATVVVDLRRGEHQQPLGLAYAVHAAKFQGHECPVVLFAPGSGYVSDSHSAYSALSRCQREMHVFLDQETHGYEPVKNIADAWKASSQKRTATWHINQAEQARKAEDLRARREATMEPVFPFQPNEERAKARAAQVEKDQAELDALAKAAERKIDDARAANVEADDIRRRTPDAWSAAVDKKLRERAEARDRDVRHTREDGPLQGRTIERDV
jgi:hypothetical protein